MKTIDCVMLANSKNHEMWKMTQAAIHSLHASSKEYKFNVYLIETNQGKVVYDGATVIQPRQPFNYNAFLNIGFERCSTEFVIIANNDLVFHPGWFEEVVKANADSASCYTDNYAPHVDMKGKIVPGYRTCYELCGWCIVAKKATLDKIGKFDEQFDFWCQDDDYGMQLKKHGLSHVFVGTSWVSHLYSQSHKTMDPKDLEAKTNGAIPKFRAKYKNTVCLTMIVKNEAKIIETMLAQVSPFISHWCIVDTGSTDGTQEVVKKFFEGRGIPGELHERPWVNFGHNRTEAMQLADGKAEYLWVMDADDGIVGNPQFFGLFSDLYAMRIGKDFSHWRHQLFRSGLNWAYKGVLHEYAHSDLAKTSGRLLGDYYIVSRCAGARNADPLKYQKDAALLEEALKTEPENARYWFYLGQSYFDYGDFKESKRCYEKRAAMGGWAEESFYAKWRAGQCAIRLGESDDEVMAQMLKAYEMRPSRAESLCNLAEYLRGKKRFVLAYSFAKLAAQIPFPDNDSLFIFRDVYQYKCLDEIAVNGSYCGHIKECYDICKYLIDKKLIPPSQFNRISANMGFAGKALGIVPKEEIVK